MTRYLVVLGVLVAGFIVSDLLQPFAENHPWRILIVILVAAPVVALVGWFLTPDSGMGVATALFLIVLGGCGWGLVAGWDARDNYLTPYCAYGARSETQRDDCLTHANTEEIDKLDTPAARFARGETGCGAGSGPLCGKE